MVQGRLRNGKLIAAKVLALESRQGLKEFMNELMAISNISHGNLVSLYGYCVEGNKRILVYNYLENNSLSQTLLGNSWLLNSFPPYCYQFTYLLYKV
jgi:serine/threonine protein kinase